MIAEDILSKGIPPFFPFFFTISGRRFCLLKRILALLSDGTDYSVELASYLKSRKDFIFKPVLFNDLSELNRFTGEFNVDMLLCDESREHEIPAQIENVCFLCEDCEVMETSETDEAR